MWLFGSLASDGLNGEFRLEVVLRKRYDEASASLCPNSVYVGTYRAIGACMCGCACGMQIPFAVGVFEHPHVALPIDDASLTQFLGELNGIEADGLGYLRSGERVA